MKTTIRKMTSIFLAGVMVLICFPAATYALPISPGAVYQTHVQDKGWMDVRNIGQTAGTTGLSLRMEAIRISLANQPAGGIVRYSVHVQDIGWMDPVTSWTDAGTTGRSLRMEAIRISLENMPGYSVEYRVHVQDIGWTDWVSNGQTAGTTGRSLRMEAIEIRIVTE